MTPLEIEALQKIAQAAAPASPAQYSVFGVLIALIIGLLVLLWKDRQTMVTKLLEAKDDMKGVIEKVSTCVANNTAAQERASEKHEIVLREVANIKDSLHQDRLHRALSPGEQWTAKGHS